MTIQTEYYGEIDFEESDILYFPDGFLGFPGLKNYLPLCLNENDDSILLMQSTEQPDVAFAVINPVYLCADYTPVLTPEELSYLKASDSGELSYYAICVVRENYLENTVNLKCPIAINPLTRTGIQVILNNHLYQCRHTLDSFPGIAKAITA